MPTDHHTDRMTHIPPDWAPPTFRARVVAGDPFWVADYEFWIRAANNHARHGNRSGSGVARCLAMAGHALRRC